MPVTVRGKVASSTSPNALVDVARMLDAARFWSQEWVWHEHRRARLLHEWDHLGIWLLHNVDTTDDDRYRRRNARARHCFAMAAHHLAEMDRVSNLLHALIARQSSDLQGRMTSIWYESKTQPPPRVRPTREKE